MVSMVDQSFTSMFPQGNDGTGLNQYPDPPHSAGSYDASNSDITSPMDMNTMYSMPSSMTFDQSLYAEASRYALGGQPSPSLYQEDGDLRMPSSGLSTASADSSAVGSPQSNPSRSGAAPEWNSQSMAVQPSIVSNDYISPDFGGYTTSGMEDSISFDFTQSKGFVGESQHVALSFSRSLLFFLFTPSSRGAGTCNFQFGLHQGLSGWLGAAKCCNCVGTLCCPSLTPHRPCHSCTLNEPLPDLEEVSARKIPPALSLFPMTVSPFHCARRCRLLLKTIVAVAVARYRRPI